MPTRPFSAVILAGGHSRRMGRDKALLELNGETLLQRQQRIARELGARQIWVAGRPDRIYPDCNFLPDSADQGPLGGVRSALEVCQTDLLLVLAVDMIWLDPVTLAQLLAENAGVVPWTESGPEPLAASYPKVALSIAEKLLATNELAVRGFARKCCEEDLCRPWKLETAELAGQFASWNSGPAGCYV